MGIRMRLSDINDNYRKGYDDSDVAKALAIQMAFTSQKDSLYDAL